jgi:phenylpyruvate tautomerase PptA (4-oxalocrotonate tautomerase family)
MTKIKPKDIVLISRLIIKLFRYSRDGLNKEERMDLADELTEILVEILSTK